MKKKPDAAAMSVADYTARALEHFSISTELLTLRLTRADVTQPTVRRRIGQAEFTLPHATDCRNSAHRRFMVAAITAELRRQAAAILPPRLAAHARRLDLRYHRVTIKNTVSRWGSCSALGNINLSLWLLLLPRELVDYVILHELAHLHELNHGPRFWAEVDRFTQGRGRLLEQQIRQYSRRYGPLIRSFSLTLRQAG